MTTRYDINILVILLFSDSKFSSEVNVPVWIKAIVLFYFKDDPYSKLLNWQTTKYR